MLCPNCGFDLGEGMLPARCPTCGRNLANLSTAPSGAEGARRAAVKRANAQGLVQMSDSTPASSHLARVFFGLVLVALAAALIGFLAWRLELFGGKGVPDVVGMRLERARTELERNGFVVDNETQKDDGLPGLVLKMSPAAGTRIREGSRIELTVSEARIMPDVVGLTQEDAESLLAEQGLTSEVSLTVSDAPAGSVLSANFEVGRILKSTDVVKLKIASSRTVPTLVGMTESDAKVALRDLGLEVQVQYQRAERGKPIGVVLSTEPAEGVHVEEGDTVRIVVSRDSSREAEESARAVLSAIYDGDPSQVSIGGRLREYLDPELSVGGKRVADATDDEIYRALVRPQGVPSEAPAEFGRLARSLVSVNNIEVENAMVTARITVRWDWSSMGPEYAGVTSTDTRTVEMGFDEQGRMLSFSDPQGDFPEYDVVNVPES